MESVAMLFVLHDCEDVQKTVVAQGLKWAGWYGIREEKKHMASQRKRK